jgi:hypothetical protein
MALLHAPLRARAAPFAGNSRVALRASAAPRVASARAPPRSPVAGLFDFLSKPEPAAASSKEAYICIDCGYIYKCVFPGGAALVPPLSALFFLALMDRALLLTRAAATSTARTSSTSARYLPVFASETRRAVH